MALRQLGASEALAAEVIALCDAQTRGISLQRPLQEVLASLDEELAPGTRLGPWRILSTLAEGGMGRVYLAERGDGQYEQRVAIKRLRALARPEDEQLIRRERQILADLVHPHIARLLDGGADASGRPHLVMEFVEGIRVDRWCREQRLGLDARLRLFQQICRAVHFAHQRMILHCDLKPSNILVRHNGFPVLLDFGIARLVGAEGRGEGGGYMTPRYASPEQKAGASVGVATDVYSLGLILTELLSHEDAEVGATVRMDAAPTVPPSDRALRDKVSWGRRLRGDLDAIVMMACAESQGQRYASSAALADDIGRFLEHHPVQARGNGLGYRMRRFVRRRWPFVAGLALMMVMAATFTLSLVYQLQRTQLAEAQARQEAEQSRLVLEYLQSVFEYANPDKGARPGITARELLDAASAKIDSGLKAAPDLQLRQMLALGWVYHAMGLPTEALQLFDKAAAIPFADERTRFEVLNAQAQGLWRQGELRKAETVARAAYEVAREVLPELSEGRAQSMTTLALILDENFKHEESKSLFEQVLQIRTTLFGPRSLKVSTTLHNLGMMAHHMGDLAKAELLYAEALAIKTEQLGRAHPNTLTTLENQARVRRDRGDYATAETLFREILQARTRIHGERSSFVADAANELANVLHDAGRYRDAEGFYRQSLDLTVLLSGEGSADAARLQNNLASLYEDRGAYASAESLYRQSLASRLTHLGEGHGLVARAQHNLARVLVKQGRDLEASSLLEKALQARRQTFGEDDAQTLGSRALQAWLLARQGDPVRADVDIQKVVLALRSLPEADPLLRVFIYRCEANIAELSRDREHRRSALQQADEVLSSHWDVAHPIRAELQLLLASDAEPAVRNGEALRAAATVVRRELDAAHPAQRLRRELGL
ncbi:MAG TPA: serine/threonine-protein kinase [Aquimonas sp.]|nr:serine/threonine-protein kinase [Aquimonas sp.]HRF52895.1 serine/threonine-protein kinase [Aquimonas sp.]